MTMATTTPMTTAVSTVPAGERSVGRGGGGMGRDTLSNNITDTGRCHTAALLDLQLISKQRITNNNTHTPSTTKCAVIFLDITNLKRKMRVWTTAPSHITTS